MKHTRFLRKRRSDERRSLQQLILTIIGSLCLLFIFFFVGIPFLVKLSSFVAGFKKESSPTQNESNIVFEPVLEPLLQATNSAQIDVSGNASSGNSVILYVNKRKNEEKVVGKDGIFLFNDVELDNGLNEIYAIAKQGNRESQSSEKLSITYKNEPPKLEIETPKNGDIFKRENQEIEIKGTTNPENTIYINDRLIIVDPSGNFSANHRLNEGENKLEIKAFDIAGNTQKSEITVTYEP